MPLRNYKLETLSLFQDMRSPSRGKPSHSFEYYVSQVKRYEPAIRKMFKAAGFSYKDPQGWYVLLGYFADTYFGKNARGRRTEWDDDAYQALRSEFVREWSRDTRQPPSTVAKKICKGGKFPSLQKEGSVLARLSEGKLSTPVLRREAIALSKAPKKVIKKNSVLDRKLIAK